MKEEFEILGFISIHRIMKKHWVYDNPLYFRAWIDMLWEVNHKDKKVLIEAQLIDCPRGSSLNSINTWVTVFSPKHWTYDKVRNFFELLEKDNMITKQGLSKTTLISICNYSKYQSKSQTDPKQNPNTSQTITEQIPNKTQILPKQIPTNNNDNKDKNADNENNVNNDNTHPPAPQGASESLNDSKDLSLQNKSPTVTITKDNFESTSVYPFEQFCKDYDKNVDYDGCFLVYAKIAEADRAIIKEVVPAYVAAQSDKRFQKDPINYLKGKCWQDDIIDRSNNNQQNCSIQQKIPTGHVSTFDDDDEF